MRRTLVEALGHGHDLDMISMLAIFRVRPNVLVKVTVDELLKIIAICNHVRKTLFANLGMHVFGAK